MEMIVLVSILLAVAVASMLWGADSVQGLDSPEWAQRKDW